MARVALITGITGQDGSYLAGGCGFVVRPGDSRSVAERWLELFADSALRDKLGARARGHFCERFDRALATAQFADVLRSVG